MPEVLAQRLGSITKNIEARAGKYSFSQLDSLRKLLVDDLGTPISKLGREQTGKLIKSIDDILTDKALKDIVPEEAVEALFKANKFLQRR